MKILAGVLFVACGVVLSSTAERNDKDNILQEILLRTQQSVNDDCTMTMDAYDVNGIAKLFDSLDIADLLNSDDVSSLMNIDDVTNVMNKDSMERLRVGIHGKTYCHCHCNYCQCCRIIYLFWKIPIFKACIGVYYEGRDFVMRLKVYGITLVKHNLPLHHQKPVCARALGVYELCAQLYNVKIHHGVVHACVKIVKPVELDLKCFTLHRKSTSEETLKLANESDPDELYESRNVD